MENNAFGITRKNLCFSEDEMAMLFGNDAAEDEQNEKFSKYYLETEALKGDVYV